MLKIVIFNLIYLNISSKKFLLANDLSDKYELIKSDYQLLKKDENRKKLRHHWEKLIHQLDNIINNEQSSLLLRNKALFIQANILFDLSRESYSTNDKKLAEKVFWESAQACQNKELNLSHLVDDALYYRAKLLIELKEPELAKKNLLLLIRTTQKGDYLSLAKNVLASLNGVNANDDLEFNQSTHGLNELNSHSIEDTIYKNNINTKDDVDSIDNIIESNQQLKDEAHKKVHTKTTINNQLQNFKYWNHSEYSRFVFEFTDLPEVDNILMPKFNNEAAKIILVFDDAAINEAFKTKMEAMGSQNIVQKMKVTEGVEQQFKLEIILGKVAEYQLFKLMDPNRVVLDIFHAPEVGQWPQSKKTATKAEANHGKPGLKQSKEPKPNINPKHHHAVKASKGKNEKEVANPKNAQYHVVIDPGHGGHDSGARGPTGVMEKTVVLAIADRLTKSLRKKGIKVTQTRTDDTFISLEERTVIANKLKADLFISVHANAHKKKSIGGIETYYLDVTSNKYSNRLAAVENKTSESKLNDIQLILTDMMTKAHTDESKSLGKALQKAMVQGARRFHPKIRDLGVKKALFYVLLGARMPAVLLETSFVSNHKEEQLLTNVKYQQEIAEKVSKGIVQYLKKHHN